MQAHIVQFDIAWEDPEANFVRVRRLLDGLDSGRGPGRGSLVLLPEMFDTGFSLHTETTADAKNLTLAFMSELADDFGCLVQGGRTVSTCAARKPAGEPCPKAFNVMSVVAPGERVLCEYRKIHPFSFGKEPERILGGESVETWRWAGADGSDASALTVCPVICYDLRFPELFRIGMKRGAEVFAIGANWPDTRQHHWRSLIIARAIENQAFVLASNRTGKDPFLSYAGGSIAVGPKGDVLGELAAEEGVLSVEVDPAAVRSWRETFPAWRDLRLI